MSARTHNIHHHTNDWTRVNSSRGKAEEGGTRGGVVDGAAGPLGGGVFPASSSNASEAGGMNRTPRFPGTPHLCWGGPHHHHQQPRMAAGVPTQQQEEEEGGGGEANGGGALQHLWVRLMNVAPEQVTRVVQVLEDRYGPIFQYIGEMDSSSSSQQSHAGRQPQQRRGGEGSRKGGMMMIGVGGSSAPPSPPPPTLIYCQFLDEFDAMRAVSASPLMTDFGKLIGLSFAVMEDVVETMARLFPGEEGGGGHHHSMPNTATGSHPLSGRRRRRGGGGMVAPPLGSSSSRSSHRPAVTSAAAAAQQHKPTTTTILNVSAMSLQSVGGGLQFMSQVVANNNASSSLSSGSSRRGGGLHHHRATAIPRPAPGNVSVDDDNGAYFDEALSASSSSFSDEPFPIRFAKGLRLLFRHLLPSFLKDTVREEYVGNFRVPVTAYLCYPVPWYRNLRHTVSPFLMAVMLLYCLAVATWSAANAVMVLAFRLFFDRV